MAFENSGSLSFPVSSGTTAYPTDGWNASTTAGNSGFATKQGIRVDGIIVEERAGGGAAAGVLTISDHAGGNTTTVNIGITTTPIQALPVYGPHGMQTPWLGIRAAMTGTAMVVRVLFRVV